MMTSWAASAAGTDRPSANAAKIKPASHTKFLTRPSRPNGAIQAVLPPSPVVLPFD
jgi:hypothetical protein